MINLVEFSRSFSAMSTGIEVIINAPETQGMEAEQALRRVEYLFMEMEQQLSRFRDDSELSRLNQSAGKEFKASPLLYEIVMTALSSAKLTGGIFDPTILPGLISAGYDRSFELLDIPRKTPMEKNNPPGHTWRDILMDTGTLSIYLPQGCGIDMGGIAKGWTVDRAGRYLEKFRNYAVNAGGDIIAKGVQADGSPWTVGIKDPLNRKPDLGVLRLSGQAVCTSTTTQRRWRTNNMLKHHLIDPRTGLPSDSGVISATVIAGTAVLAETLSKAALILGPQDGLQLIERQRPVQAIMVLNNGRRLTSFNFRESRFSHE
ncbi:MAG: FAD:protein FMN transferase [Dehalococcoidales bacterium]|nr:FAD:protein FMN transferase [Dehalococcoidales bacterium]